MDINNPLEDIKVQAALQSEMMKLQYRRENKPKDVNILDYTVIEALEKQAPKKAEKSLFPGISGKCPECNTAYREQVKYCSTCGQKLDWSEE